MTMTPPTPGEDCFPVQTCPSNTTIISFQGTDSGQTDPEKMPFQLFIDINGFGWLAILEYAEHPSLGTAPFWVWLYKSTAAIECADVRTAGTTGLDLDLEYRCNYMAAGWNTSATSDECDYSDGAFFDGESAIPSGKVFNRRISCCSGVIDECNPPPDNICPDVESLCCPVSDATFSFVIEIDINDDMVTCIPCAVLNGTYVVSYLGSWPQSMAVVCPETSFYGEHWRLCIPFVATDCDADESVSMAIYFILNGYGGGCSATVFINGFNVADCPDDDIATDVVWNQYQAVYLSSDISTVGDCQVATYAYEEPNSLLEFPFGTVLGGCASGGSIRVRPLTA